MREREKGKNEKKLTILIIETVKSFERKVEVALFKESSSFRRGKEKE